MLGPEESLLIRLLHYLTTLPDAIRSIVDWSEMGPRIAEYNKAISKGYSQAEAAAMARRVTQDFGTSRRYSKRNQ